MQLAARGRKSRGNPTGAQVSPRELGVGGRSVFWWLEATRLATTGSTEARTIRTMIRTFGVCQRAAKAQDEQCPVMDLHVQPGRGEQTLQGHLCAGTPGQDQNERVGRLLGRPPAPPPFKCPCPFFRGLSALLL